MTSFDESLWPVRQPPAGFAAATVSRMVTASRPSGMARARTSWVLWSIAALFISSAAYGWVQLRAVTLAAASPTVALPLARTEANMLKRVGSLPSVSFRRYEGSAPAVLRHTAPRKPVATSEAVKVEGMAHEPHRVPACRCERGFSDFICDCY